MMAEPSQPSSDSMEFCRTCLTAGVDLRSIFKAGMICGQVTKLADMLASCTNLEISPDDGLPVHICSSCVSHLSRAFAFIRLCLKSDDTLRARIQEKVQQQYMQLMAADERAEESTTTTTSTEAAAAAARGSETDTLDDDDDGGPSDDQAVVLSGEYTVLDCNNIMVAVRDESENGATDSDWIAVDHMKTNNNAPAEEATTAYDGHQLDAHDDDDAVEIDLDIKTGIVDEDPLNAAEDTNQAVDETMIDKAEYIDDEMLELENDGGDEENIDFDDVQHLEEESVAEDSNNESCTDGGTPAESGDNKKMVLIYKTRHTAELQPFKPTAARPSASMDKPTTSTRRQPTQRTRRNPSAIERPPGPPFECGECHKKLSNFNSYKYHMRLHSDETPYVCAVCGDGFKTPNAYDGHMITHNANNPHTCTICQKSYRQAASLRSHMLTHTGEKPFTCPICGKGMTQKSGYKKHMLTHSGEKPHQCDVCLKFFRFSSNLFMHKRSHSNERPYACDECERSFNTSEQLKRHKSTHAGERDFECDVCGRGFNRKASMMTHRNLHYRNGKRPKKQATSDAAADEEEDVHGVDEMDDEMGPYETLELENDSDEQEEDDSDDDADEVNAEEVIGT